MLYDPTWEVKTDPMSITSLIAWLESQPRKQKFCYVSNGDCLLARYLAYLGYRGVDVRAYGKWTALGASGQFNGINRIANPAWNASQTYGEALRIARSLV